MDSITIKEIELDKITEKLKTKWKFSQIRTSFFNKTQDLIIFGGNTSGCIFFLDISQKQFIGKILHQNNSSYFESLRQSNSFNQCGLF